MRALGKLKPAIEVTCERFFGLESLARSIPQSETNKSEEKRINIQGHFLVLCVGTSWCARINPTRRETIR